MSWSDHRFRSCPRPRAIERLVEIGKRGGRNVEIVEFLDLETGRYYRKVDARRPLVRKRKPDPGAHPLVLWQVYQGVRDEQREQAS